MKNMRLTILCMLVLLCGTVSYAQGIRVYKKDGTSIKVLYSELDSIVGVPASNDADTPVIVLGGHAGDENGNNKDSKIMFSLSCTSKDASYAEMFVAKKSDVDALTDNGYTLLQIADANMGNGVILGSAGLDEVNNDVYWLSMDNTDGVAAGTEYTCIAMVMNTAEKSVAVRYDVKTDSSADDNTPPTVELEGRAGDADGNLKNEAVTFKASCKSKNASYAEAFIAEASFINDILQGTTLEDLMKYNAGIGKILDNETLDKLNSSYIELTWDMLLPDTEYSLLFCVKTKGEGMTVKRCDVKTAAAATSINRNYDAEGMLSRSNIKLGNKGKVISNLRAPK